jgi:hypothetical protein
MDEFVTTMGPNIVRALEEINIRINVLDERMRQLQNRVWQIGYNVSQNEVLTKQMVKTANSHTAAMAEIVEGYKMPQSAKKTVT